MIIDAFLHAWRSEDRPSHATADVTPAGVIAEMDRWGVGGAMLASPWSPYGADTAFIDEACAAHPGRFRLIAGIDLRLPNVGERVSRWAEHPGAAGIRMLATRDHPVVPDDPRVTEVVRAAGENGLTVGVLAPGNPGVVEELGRLHPDVQLVLEHLRLTLIGGGLSVPDAVESVLPRVLAIASRENVAVNLIGACALADERAPQSGSWEIVDRIIAAFGVDRTMWASGWTGAGESVSAADIVRRFRALPVSDPEREAVLGGTAARIFGWSVG